MGRPMLLGVPIPGQEEKNSAFLVGCGAALPASKPQELRAAVSELIARPDRLARMRRAAQEAARPRAAFEILDAALRLNSAN